MNLPTILSAYWTLNLMLALGFIVLSLYSFLAEKLDRPLQGCSELRLHYLLLVTILGATLVGPLLPQQSFIGPAAKVWSQETIKLAKEKTVSGYISVPVMKDSSYYSTDQVSLTLALVALTVLIAGLIFLGRDLYRLFQIRQESFLVRRRGQVLILSNANVSIPFSYRTFKYCHVVVPEFLLTRPKDLQIAISHELQHHRQFDTLWVYVLWLLRILCILNPFIHLWSKILSHIQEFACDEALIGHHKVESQQYARCLIEVAETAFIQKQRPISATGTVFLFERNLLKRRIVKMTTQNKKMKNSVNGLFALIIALFMMATAYASQGLIQDKRISMEEAVLLFQKATEGSELPLVINDLVLKQLNRFLGTPSGREQMKDALNRMESYRSLITGKLKEYNVPMELMAVPVVESGYQNLAHSKLGWGSGLWMFIASTARNFGLKVDKKVDERLNVELATRAAIRYLKSNHLLFNDWFLALMAYNMGENSVKKAIQKTGTRDAWTIISMGHEGDKDYLAKVMATVIIMKNPEALQ